MFITLNTLSSQKKQKKQNHVYLSSIYLYIYKCVHVHVCVYIPIYKLYFYKCNGSGPATVYKVLS